MPRPNEAHDEKMRRYGFVSVPEAAARLSMSRNTLYAIPETEVPRAKIGARIYFNKEKLLQHLGEGARVMWLAPSPTPAPTKVPKPEEVKGGDAD